MAIDKKIDAASFATSIFIGEDAMILRLYNVTLQDQEYLLRSYTPRQ